MEHPQRCAEHDADGRPCYRSVEADWRCVQCGKPVCRWHGSSVTFNNCAHAGSACWCSTCMLNHSSASGELPAHKVFALMLGAAIANEQHTFKLLSQQALKTLNANCGFTDEQRERLQKTLAQMTTVDGAVDSDIDEEQVTAPRGRKKEQAE